MKIFLLIIACFFCSCSIAQARMVLIVKDKKCDILGYAMDPDGTGDKQSISILGVIQNAETIFQLSYMGASPISSVEIFSAAPNADNTLIKLTDVTVYAIKKNLSSYNNGACVISSSGNANTELKCKFTTYNINQGPSVVEPVISKVDVNDQTNFNGETEQKWDMQPDPSLKGLTGEVTMQIPKELRFNTHMEFYETGDNKKPVASWFGNNKAKLLPGLYDIVIDKKYTIKNVPVELGKQTRLKMGVLQWSGNGSILLEDGTHQKFSYSPPFKIVLPAGTYTIVGKKQKPNTFVITDGKLTEF